MVQWASRAHTDITYIYICAHTHTHLKTICIYMQSSRNILYNLYIYIYVYVCVCNQPECWCLVVISGLGGKMGEFRLVGMRCLNYLGANRRIVFFWFHQPDLIWPRKP